MFKYLEQLRQKPEKVKKKFAFLSAFSFAGIIFIIWLSVVYPNLNEQKKIDDKVKSLEPSPLSSFFETVSVGFRGIGSGFYEIKTIVEDFSLNVENDLKNSSTSNNFSNIQNIENIEQKSVQIINVSEISSSTEATSTKNIE